MIINMLWIVGLVVAGWSGHILYVDIKNDLKRSRQRKRQEREDDEVLRIVSGLSEDDPEVDVGSEEIKPTLRERLEDRWLNLWRTSAPRTAEQVAGTGFTRLSLHDLIYRSKEKPVTYTGRHRADKTLHIQGGEDGLPVEEEAVLRRDHGEAGPGPSAQDDGVIDSGRAKNLPLPLVQGLASDEEEVVMVGEQPNT
jgi:hypothetical protein